MKRPALRNPRSPWFFALLGAWVGGLIVGVAWLLAGVFDPGWTVGAIGEVHRDNPALWFVDATPIWLAWAGWLVGLNEGLVGQLRRRPRTPPPAPARPDTPTLEIEVRRGPSAVVARFAHELRTPLNAVLGYGEMLGEELEERGLEDLKEDADKLGAAARHLVALVDDVVDMARLEAGRLPVLLEPVHLPPLIEEAVSTVTPLAGDKGNVLRREVAEDLPEVRGDPIRIRQVLINLLGNAAKFTEGGTITVAARAQSDGVAVEVVDTGIGMAPEQLARLFRDFEQADPQHGGSGLGLAISRRLVELMGGRIVVESEEGAGSTFRIVLPVAGGRRTAAATTLELAPQHVVLAIGSRQTRDLVRSVLVRSGLVVWSAGSAAEVLERVRQEPPRAVVVGEDVPGGSGLELLARLADEAEGLPVVWVGPRGLAEVAWSRGAAEVLTPPLDLRGLFGIARRYRSSARCRVGVVEPDGALRETLVDALSRDGLRVAAATGSGELDALGDGLHVVVLDALTLGDDLEPVLDRLSGEGPAVLAFSGSTMVDVDLLGLIRRCDRLLVTGGDEREELVTQVRNAVGELLADR